MGLHKTLFKLAARAFLVLTVMSMTVGAVYAWFVLSKFSSTQDVSFFTSNQRQMTIDFSTDGEVWTADDSIDFLGLCCGSRNRKTLFVRVHNMENEAVSISLRIQSPNDGQNGEESPLVATGSPSRYYYLGSQIKVAGITATLSDGTETDILDAYAGDSFLVTTAPMGGGQQTYVTSEVTAIGMIQLLDGASIPPQQTQIFRVIFEFVDNGSNQNIYQHFANNPDACCTRRLFAYLGAR